MTSENPAPRKTATYKGLVFLGIKNFIKENYGNEGVEKFLGQFAPDDRRYLENVMPITKIPAEMLMKCYRVLLALWGNGKPEYYVRVLKHVAKLSLNSFMQFFIRIGSPTFIAQNAPMIWSHFFDTGRLICTQATSHSAEFRTEGGEAYGEALCHGILGFGEFAVELSGGKNIRTHHDVCIYKGNASCIFKVEWD